MTIFTSDQIIQMVFSTYEIYSKLLGAIWDAIFIDLIKYFGIFTISLFKGDVSGLLISAFVFFSLTMLAYRLIRKKPLSFIGHFLNEIF